MIIYYIANYLYFRTHLSHEKGSIIRKERFAGTCYLYPIENYTFLKIFSHTVLDLKKIAILTRHRMTNGKLWTATTSFIIVTTMPQIFLKAISAYKVQLEMI
jgi:hypothetical protein